MQIVRSVSASGKERKRCQNRKGDQVKKDINADIGFESFAESFLSCLTRDDTILPSLSNIPVIFECKEKSLIFFDRPSGKSKFLGSNAVRIHCLRKGRKIAENALWHFEIAQSMRWL
jgi:hypothetical protein